MYVYVRLCMYMYAYTNSIISLCVTGTQKIPLTFSKGGQIRRQVVSYQLSAALLPRFPWHCGILHRRGQRAQRDTELHTFSPYPFISLSPRRSLPPYHTNSIICLCINLVAGRQFLDHTSNPPNPLFLRGTKPVPMHSPFSKRGLSCPPLEKGG